jgi:hypothetical protein
MDLQSKLPESREGVRQWYERTTRNWRKALIWATVIAVAGAIPFFVLGNLPTFTRLQTFNGAIVIPLSAGIWIAAFVYIFLVPSREVGFRSQEWIEMAVTMMQKTIDEKIAPGTQVWMRIGERIEKEIPEFIKEFKEGIRIVRDSAVKIEAVVAKNEKAAEEVKPLVASIRKLQESIEREIKAGFLVQVREAAEAIKVFAGRPSEAVPDEDKPSLDKVLVALGRKR